MSPGMWRPPGARSRVEVKREAETRRGSARERGYTFAWDKAAKGHLRSHPLCAYCALDDRVTAATLVDHLYPHQGDTTLFWRTEFWVASCKPCHDGPKQAAERAGRAALDHLARRLGRPTL